MTAQLLDHAKPMNQPIVTPLKLRLVMPPAFRARLRSLRYFGMQEDFRILRA